MTKYIQNLVLQAALQLELRADHIRHRKNIIIFKFFWIVFRYCLLWLLFVLKVCVWMDYFSNFCSVFLVVNAGLPLINYFHSNKRFPFHTGKYFIFYILYTVSVQFTLSKTWIKTKCVTQKRRFQHTVLTFRVDARKRKKKKCAPFLLTRRQHHLFHSCHWKVFFFVWV